MCDELKNSINTAINRSHAGVSKFFHNQPTVLQPLWWQELTAEAQWNSSFLLSQMTRLNI